MIPGVAVIEDLRAKCKSKRKSLIALGLHGMLPNNPNLYLSVPYPSCRMLPLGRPELVI